MTAGRQPRQSRDELRALLLETGRNILRQEGLSSGAAALTFKKVFERAEAETGIRITKASVIRRVWQNQAEFQADVLVTIALDQHQEQIEGGLGAVAPVRMSTSPSPRPEVAMRELCRVVGDLNAYVVRKSSDWPLWIGVWAPTASGQPLDDRKRIEAALLSGFEGFTRRIVDAYAGMAAFLGYRVRRPFSVRQFAIAADSLGQGYGLRDRIDDSVTEDIILPA